MRIKGIMTGKTKRAIKAVGVLTLSCATLTGCSVKKIVKDADILINGSAIDEETASDAVLDLTSLEEENPDIFGWMYIPGTTVDCPILQSSEGDDAFYVIHNAKKENDANGAVFIEAGNLKNMCDFNEVFHANANIEGNPMAALYNYEDRTFFENNEYLYIYLDDNALTYDVFAAFERDDTRLLQQYDFTYAKGCQEFIDEIYSSVNSSMNANIRSGWESGVSPEHFLVTVTVPSRHDPSKQFVVVGCLVGDATGSIDRVVDWSDPQE